MKRFLAVLLALSLAFSLAACQRAESEGEDAEEKKDKYSSNADDDDDAADDDDAEDGGNKGDKDEPEANKGGKYDEIIASAGVDSVTFEIVKNDGVYATINAQVPDYTALLTRALNSSDPEKYFANAISNGDYNTVEYTGRANVATDPNGKEIILSDELIEGFVEQELIKAINAILEAEEGEK